MALQGEAVTDQVKNSDDPSQYTVLVDDYYVNSDGTPPLESDTAEIPDGSGNGDSDLAQITLRGLNLLAWANLAVYMDMYPQMLAYQSGQLNAINQMAESNEISPAQLRGWQLIDAGRTNPVQVQIWNGNRILVQYEQQVTLQEGAYNADLAYWNNVTNTWNLLVPAISSPIPGYTSTFQQFRAQSPIVPDDASIGDYQARWTWILLRQLPAYMNTWSPNNLQINIQKLLSGGYTP